MPHVSPVLQRDLERNLDGDRPGIGEEDACQARRSQRRQPAGQPQCGLVHQAAEHHVRHRLELPRHALEDMRVIVAVADAPPRRDAVDQLAAVGQHDAAAVRPYDGQRRRGDLHLAIGEPDMRKTLFIPVLMHDACCIRSGRQRFLGAITHRTGQSTMERTAISLRSLPSSLGRAYTGTSVPAN